MLEAKKYLYREGALLLMQSSIHFELSLWKVFFPIVICPTINSLITATPTYIETCTFPDQFIEIGVIPTYIYPDHRMSQDLYKL